MRVAIVGGGIVGTCVARAAARLGASVTVIDPLPAGDPATASGGDSRLVRLAHGDDRVVTTRAAAALEAWRAIDPDGALGLFVRSGIAFIARGDDSFASASLRAIEASGLRGEIEWLSRTEASARWPSMELRTASGVLFEPRSGFARAARATSYLAERAAAEGITRRKDRCARLEARGHEVALTLASGEAIVADRVVIAAGARSRELCAAWTSLEIRATRQAVLLWEGVSHIETPAYVDLDNNGLYGMPDDGAGTKSALHEPGPDVPLDDVRTGFPTEAEMLATRVAAARLYPALTSATAAKASYLCHYDRTPTGEFVIARMHDAPSVFVAAGFSGTGFKWAPLLGQEIAAWVVHDEAGFHGASLYRS